MLYIQSSDASCFILPSLYSNSIRGSVGSGSVSLVVEMVELSGDPDRYFIVNEDSTERI